MIRPCHIERYSHPVAQAWKRWLKLFSGQPKTSRNHVAPKGLWGKTRGITGMTIFVQLFLHSSSLETSGPSAPFLEEMCHFRISHVVSGKRFPSWMALKASLGDVCCTASCRRLPGTFPCVRQVLWTAYVHTFTKLSLWVRDLNNNSWLLLFIWGLFPTLRTEALHEHPTLLSEGIWAAHLAQRLP